MQKNQDAYSGANVVTITEDRRRVGVVSPLPHQAEYITEQTTPPIQVGATRGFLGGLGVGFLMGLQDALKSHQVGFSWGDSIESGVLIAVPILISAVIAFTGWGAYDQFVKAKKVA